MGNGRGIRTRELSLRRSTWVILVADLIIGALLFYSMFETSRQFHAVREATERYVKYQDWTAELKESAEFLTDTAKNYTVTFDPEQVILYYNELSVTRRQEDAYAHLTEEITDARVLRFLEDVVTLSETMREREQYAMRLVAEARGEGLSQYPAALQEVEIREGDDSLGAEEMIQKAREMVFDEDYVHLFGQMQTRISWSVGYLLESLQEEQHSGSVEVDRLLQMEQLLVYLFVFLMLLAVVFIFRLVIRPLRRNAENIEKEEMLEIQGASELTFLARTYNKMLEQIRKSQRKLSFEASHDSLTGLYNRHAYDSFLAAMQEEEIALLIMDVDRFKQFNDTYGHDIGDKVLRRVSAELQHTFRSGDRVCRIGGDEFAVIMQNMRPELTHILRMRITSAMQELAVPLDDVPMITLSVGAAFSQSAGEDHGLFKCADLALYEVKHRGGNGCRIYGEEES